MDQETELSKEEEKKVWDLLSLNKGRTYITAKDLVLKRITKQKRLI